MANGKPPLLPRWLIIAVIVLALVMWVVSIGYSAINPKWPVPASVHGVVIAVVTGVLGYVAVSKRVNGNGG